MRVFVNYLNCISALSEYHRLRVFENRVLKRIFGSKGKEVTGYWRTLNND
jgi:hypothetical protein